MRKLIGFTLIELLIVIAVIAILASIIIPLIASTTKSNYSVGLTGVVEKRCVEGHYYLLTSGKMGTQLTPMLDDTGKPLTCEK